MSKWIVASVVALGGLGCGASANAHLVRSTPEGGTVAYEGAYMERVAKGMIVMSKHCDGEFQVLDESGQPVDAPARDQPIARFECSARR